MTYWLTQAALATTLVLMPCIAQSGDYPMGGLTPWQRPAGAPVIAAVHHNPAWYTRALTGVRPPYPASLRFLEDQGNWYTPFNHPGATGPYDIRGWYH